MPRGKKPIDMAHVRRRLAEGGRVKEIADEVGVSSVVLRRRIRERDALVIEKQDKLCNISGSVVLDNRLAAFLYTLMRDRLPAGAVADLVYECCEHSEWLFTNGWLARYAQHLAEMLQATEGGDGKGNAD